MAADGGGRKYASSFPDVEGAEEALGQLFDQRRDDIEAWLTGPDLRRPFEADLGWSTGRMARWTGEVGVVTGVRAILIHNTGMPEGFQVHASFPQQAGPPTS